VKNHGRRLRNLPVDRVGGGGILREGGEGKRAAAGADRTLSRGSGQSNPLHLDSEGEGILGERHWEEFVDYQICTKKKGKSGKRSYTCDGALLLSLKGKPKRVHYICASTRVLPRWDRS